MLLKLLTMLCASGVWGAYYELAVQNWCSSDYMIHGLWPQFNSTDYPIYCKNVSYYMPNDTLLLNMNTYWQSCDNSLWEHEWEKHGSCIPNITEDTYFNTAISLFLNNTDKLHTCSSDNCILACFDLNYTLIDCE